jgi:hypothetical protein
VDGGNHTILRQDVNLSRLVCLFRHVLMLRRRKGENFGVSGACETSTTKYEKSRKKQTED